MESMLIVFIDDKLNSSLCDTIARLDGVETVYETDGSPSYIVVTKPFMGDKVVDDLRVLMFIERIEVYKITARQEHARRIIDEADIPGGPVQRPVKLRVAQPIITSADIPGPRPAMRAPARVYHNISSQAWLGQLRWSV